MQATVHRFEGNGAGSVLTQDGMELTFDAEVFAASGLRMLRPGQRVSVEVGAQGVTRLWIVGIGADERIR